MTLYVNISFARSSYSDFEIFNQPNTSVTTLALNHSYMTVSEPSVASDVLTYDRTQGLLTWVNIKSVFVYFEKSKVAPLKVFF